MSLTEKKKTEWEQTLKEANLITSVDSIQEHTQGDFWELFGQTRGNFFFTNSNFVFVGGLMNSTSFSIPYENISKLKRCNVGGLIPVMPTGIRVTYTDEKGKVRKKKCSVLKRKEWMKYLSEKANISSL